MGNSIVEFHVAVEMISGCRDILGRARLPGPRYFFSFGFFSLKDERKNQCFFRPCTSASVLVTTHEIWLSISGFTSTR